MARGEHVLSSAFSNDELDHLLANCVRSLLTDQPPARWEWQGGQSADLTRALSDRAEFHGIALLLAEHRGTLAAMPEDAAEAIRSQARRQVIGERLHKPRLAALIERLHAAGVASLLLKGAAIAYLYYPSPAARPRGDTDLLIDEADLGRARETFLAQGWVRQSAPGIGDLQETWTLDCGGGMTHAVDLHWQMSNRAVLRRMLAADAFRARREPVVRLSACAFAPDPVLLLVHGAVNQTWHEHRGFHLGDEILHGGRRLIWAVDYHLLCRHFTAADWERLVAYCTAHDTGAVVHHALTGAINDIGLCVPAGIMDRLLPASGRSPAFDYICNSDTFANIRADIAAAESLAIGARVLWRALFAPRAQLLERYPEATSWPTPALFARRIGGGLVRVLRSGGAGSHR
jgi:hypothetical protein